MCICVCVCVCVSERVEGQRRWDGKNEYKHMFLQYYLPLQAFNSQLLLVLCFLFAFIIFFSVCVSNCFSCIFVLGRGERGGGL